MLGNRLMYLYTAFQCNVISASTTYTKYKSQIQMAFITYEIHFRFQEESHWIFFHPYHLTQ